MSESCSWADVRNKLDPFLLSDGTKVYNIPNNVIDSEVEAYIHKLQEEIQSEEDPSKTKRIIAEFERLMVSAYRDLIYTAASYIASQDEIVLERITADQLQTYLNQLTENMVQTLSPQVLRYLQVAAVRGVLDSGERLLSIGVEPPGGTDEKGYPEWGNHPVDQSVLDVMENLTGDDITRLNQDTISNIMREVKTGILNNQHPRVTARTIRDKANITLNRARMIARTETINTFNQAAEARYKAYGIEQFIIIVAADERTCMVCQLEAAGGPYKFANGGHRPSFHPNCRCIIAPLSIRRSS